jgi:hypothetical protein
MQNLKIEEFCTPIKVLSLIFIFFVSFLFLPTLAQPNSQQTVCDIRPHAYSVVNGARIGGNLNSVYEDDSETLNFRSTWFWLGAYYEFYIDVFFYFDEVMCDELYLDFLTYFAVSSNPLSIVVYYTDGTLDSTPPKSSGFHVIALDETKYISRVLVHFIDRSYLVSGGDRLLFVDLIAAKPAGDNTPPNINIDYQDGDGTDSNPGKWDVYAYDDESSINQDSISVWIDGQFAGNTLGEYDVPSSLGDHTIDVEVENIIGCPFSISESIRIMDDDMVLPVISYSYNGDGTDNDSGEIVISATDQSGLHVDPSGSYPVPNTPGTHGFIFSATDNDDDRPNDRLTRTISISINIADDDHTPPEIDIQYVGDGNDGDPGYFEWVVSDLDSEITEINATVTYESSEGLDNYTIAIDATEMGSWNLPTELGIYTLEIFAKDNDNDRINDALSRTRALSNSVIDDDNAPPEIDIQYFGGSFDNEPGYFEWNVYDLNSAISEINVTISYESTEGLDDYSMPLVGTETGMWNLPSNLGLYTISISARDTDDDRTLIIDSLTSELSRGEDIIDDDITPPELSNLIIVPDINEINVTFDATDNSGIGNISFLFNGELVEPLSQIQCESTYSFILKNQWLFNSESEIVVQVEDSDSDRPNDALTSSINGTFKNVYYNMFEYIIWQIEQLKIYINETIGGCIAFCLNRKLTNAQDHLYEAFYYFENGSVTCSLYQDAMAKAMLHITEFKVELLNKYDRIADDHAEFIENSLHEIRNNIIILMGTSTGTEHGVKIAYIEVDLFNLRDFIEEEINWTEGLCLYLFLKLATCALERAIFKISKGEDIGCLLDCVMWKLDVAACLTKCLLQKGIITQEVADILLDGISQAQTNLEEVQNSL